MISDPQPRKSAAIYTSITGGYDHLYAPEFVDPDLDYIAFVDEATDVPAPWLRAPIPHRSSDERRTSRYPKMHPHRMLPEYEITAWVDGSFQIRNLTAEALRSMVASSPVACFQHPWRNCVYEEAKEVLILGKDVPQRVESTVALLEAEGFPHQAGLVESGFIVRRNHDPLVQQAMEEWWRTIQTYSVRDQLSFMFVLHRHGVPLHILPGFSRDNEWIHWKGHPHEAGQAMPPPTMVAASPLSRFKMALSRIRNRA